MRGLHSHSTCSTPRSARIEASSPSSTPLAAVDDPFLDESVKGPNNVGRDIDADGFGVRSERITREQVNDVCPG